MSSALEKMSVFVPHHKWKDQYVQGQYEQVIWKSKSKQFQKISNKRTIKFSDI
jgi:hypothetical protein